MNAHKAGADDFNRSDQISSAQTQTDYLRSKSLSESDSDSETDIEKFRVGEEVDRVHEVALWLYHLGYKQIRPNEVTIEARKLPTILWYEIRKKLEIRIVLHKKDRNVRQLRSKIAWVRACAADYRKRFDTGGQGEFDVAPTLEEHIASVAQPRGPEDNRRVGKRNAGIISSFASAIDDRPQRPGSGAPSGGPVVDRKPADAGPAPDNRADKGTDGRNSAPDGEPDNPVPLYAWQGRCRKEAPNVVALVMNRVAKSLVEEPEKSEHYLIMREYRRVYDELGGKIPPPDMDLAAGSEE